MQMDLSLHTELVGAGLLANSKLEGSLQLRQEKNLPYMIRTSPSAQKVSCLTNVQGKWKNRRKHQQSPGSE